MRLDPSSPEARDICHVCRMADGRARPPVAGQPVELCDLHVALITVMAASDGLARPQQFADAAWFRWMRQEAAAPAPHQMARALVLEPLPYRGAIG